LPMRTPARLIPLMRAIPCASRGSRRPLSIDSAANFFIADKRRLIVDGLRPFVWREANHRCATALLKTSPGAFCRYQSRKPVRHGHRRLCYGGCAWR
jgi:hypothetical protein